MNLSLALFLIGILGFILNRKNIILMIIAIEIMLLAVTLLILISSFGFDDNIGQIFSIYIISIAGAESVIGLSILVAYYRLTISLLSYYLSYNKPFVKNVNKSPLSIGKGLRNYSTNNNSFGIIASLARSFDASHIENNRIHLISSIFLLEYNHFDNFSTLYIPPWP